MEIVLLWLDELDDLLFAALAVAERLRRACLRVGLGAALALALSELAVLEPGWDAAFAGTAAASVGLWFTVLIGARLAAEVQSPAAA